MLKKEIKGLSDITVGGIIVKSPCGYLLVCLLGKMVVSVIHRKTAAEVQGRASRR